MTDYTDLIARLRIVPLHSGFGSTCHAAADALEAQARLIAELEERIDAFEMDAGHAAARIAELEGELKFELHDRKEWMKLFVARGERIAELEAALKECADELEAWIDETYKSGDGSIFTQCKFQYDRDIVTVRAARAALGEKG